MLLIFQQDEEVSKTLNELLFHMLIAMPSLCQKFHLVKHMLLTRTRPVALTLFISQKNNFNNLMKIIIINNSVCETFSGAAERCLRTGSESSVPDVESGGFNN